MRGCLSNIFHFLLGAPAPVVSSGCTHETGTGPEYRWGENTRRRTWSRYRGEDQSDLYKHCRLLEEEIIAVETSTPAKSTSRRWLKGYVHRHLFGILAVGVNLTYTLIPGQATDGKDHHRTELENLLKGQKLTQMNPDSLNCTNERFFWEWSFV